MNLAPLADVVAYLDCDPSRMESLRQALDGRFDAVWSPREGCVMATRALPRSLPDGQDVRATGTAFAEGRDSLGATRWRDLAFESLPGNVGFVRATPQGVLVARSAPGTVPWYAWQDGERALVTTTFTELVRLLPMDPELDLLVCGMWAGSNATFPDGRTFLRHVVAVPPGHSAEVSPGRPVCPRPWWNRWPEEEMPWPSRRARVDHVQRFGEAVLTALDREVADEPVNLLSLSGGVDSSVLAYLAGRHLGRPLAALSLVPPAGAPESELEASYLDPMVHDLGISPHIRHPLNAAHRLALVAGAPPVALPVLHPVLHMLPGLVREQGFEVLVGGEYADELCGGWFALPDWLDAHSFPRLVKRARSLPSGRSDVRAWARRRSPRRPAPGPWPASLPEWVSPEVDQEYRAWRGAQEVQLRASQAPHRFQRAVFSWLDGALAMNWEVCSFLGVRRAFPFVTAEVLEVLAACHPSELLGPGPKRLERQAFAQLVPDRLLQRPDKSGWQDGEQGPLGARQAVPGSIAAVFGGSEERPTTAVHARAVEILSRFAEQVAEARAQRGTASQGAAANPRSEASRTEGASSS